MFDIPRLRYFLSDLSYVLVSWFLTILPEHPLELNVFSDLSYAVQKMDVITFFNFFMTYYDNRKVNNK